jgi:hypothetical protein
MTVQIDESAVNAGGWSYAEYLRSPQWKAIREQSLCRALWRCQSPICRRADYRALTDDEIPQHGRYRLEVHHLTYERVGGQELPDDLIVLCDECHHFVHDIDEPDDPVARAFKHLAESLLEAWRRREVRS